MSAMGGFGTAVGAGIGVASMFGKMGALAPLVDPFAAGAAGFGAAGIGGAALGAAVPLGLAYGAGKVMSTFVGGGQQQQMIQNQLGAFGHMNQASRTGQGFTRDDALAIGSQIRALANIPEMMTSVEELTRMIPKMKSMGVMQGVRDATEFAGRFKETIRTVRDMSKLLGTTMEEAADFFAHSRGVGFLGRQAQLQNVLSAQFTAGVTGMTTGQVMGMQAGGAGLATAMGARRSLGATAVTNIAQGLGMAQQTGRLQAGLLEDITGMQGPDAVQAASQQLTEVMMRIGQSPAGRLVMAGMVKFDETGKAIGLDESMVKRLQTGQLSMTELKQRASQLTNRQKISFTARNSDLMMSLAGQVGPGGIGQFIKQIGEDRYGEEGTNLILQRQGGMNASQADVFQQMIGQMGGGQDMQAFGQRQAREAAIREHTDPKAIFQRLKTRMFASTLGGTQEAGARVFNVIGKAYDSFIDDLVGRHVISLSKSGADNLARAMAGGNDTELKAMFAAAHGMSGGTSATSSLASKLGGTEFAAFLKRGSTDTGRTAVAELARAQQLFGGDVGGQGSALNRGAGGGFGAAGAALAGITAGISNFGDMSSARKLDEVRAGIAQKIAVGLGNFGGMDPTAVRGLLERGDMKGLALAAGGAAGLERIIARMESSPGGAQAAALLRGGMAAQGKFGGADFLTSLAAAAQGAHKGFEDQIDFSKVASGQGAQSFLDVEFRKKALVEAGSDIDSAVDDPGVRELLKSNPDARALLKRAWGGGTEGEKITNALRLPTNEAAAELARMGIKVSQAEISQLKGAIQAGRVTDVKSGKPMSERIMKSMGVFELAEKAADFQVVSDSFNEAASQMQVASRGLSGGAAEQVQAVATSLSEAAKGKGSFADVRSNLGRLLRGIEGATPEQQEKMLAAAGPLRRALEESMAAGRGLKGAGALSRKQIAQRFGVAEGDIAEALSAIGITGTTKGKLDAATIGRIEEIAAGAKGARILSDKGKTEVAGDKDAKLLEVLNKINTTIDLNSTAIQALSGDAKKAVEAREKALNGPRENSNSTSGGKSTGGS
jgi:hypothetical protein